MPRFTVVIHEEQHYDIEAESEEALRHRIEHVDGPVASWTEGAEIIEIHDRIVSIEAD